MSGPITQSRAAAPPGAIGDVTIREQTGAASIEILRDDDLVEVVEVHLLDRADAGERDGAPAPGEQSLPLPPAGLPPGGGLDPSSDPCAATDDRIHYFEYGDEPAVTRDNLMTLARIIRRVLCIAARAIASELSQNTCFTIIRAGISPISAACAVAGEGFTAQTVMLAPGMGPLFILVNGRKAISARCARRVDGRVDGFIAGAIAAAIPGGWKGIATLEAGPPAYSPGLLRAIPEGARAVSIEVGVSIGEAESVMYMVFPLAVLAPVIASLTGTRFESRAVAG